MKPTTTNLLYIILGASTLCVIIPVFIWSLISLHNHRHKQYFIKRRLPLVYANIYCLAIMGCFQNIIDPIRVLENRDVDDYGWFSDLCYHMGNISIWFFWSSYLVRVWLLYFDMQLSQLLQNRSWQMSIDPSIASQNNIYLNAKYQRRFGNNGKYLLRIAFIVSLILAITHTVLAFFNLNLLIVATGAIFVIVTVTIAISLWRRLSLFKSFDSFGIYKELKAVVIVVIIAGILQIIQATIINLYQLDAWYAPGVTSGLSTAFLMYLTVPYVVKVHKKRETKHQLALMMAATSRSESRNSVMNSGNGIRGVKRVISNSNRNNNNNRSMRQLSHRDRDRDRERDGSRIDSSIVTGIDDKHNVVHMDRWEQIVQTQYGFEIFMNHLVAEFAVENLIFICEYMQIKEVLKRCFSEFEELLEEPDTYKKIEFEIILPYIDDSLFVDDASRASTPRSRAHSGSATPNSHHHHSQSKQVSIIPVSSIAKKLFNDREIIEAFKSLYHKFIDENNAPLMINISSKPRRKLEELLDKYYYERTKSNRTQIKNNVSSFSTDGAHVAHVANGNDQSGNGNFKAPEIQIVDDIENRCVIDDKYIKSGRSIKWLIIELVSKMDVAAREITTLMNDSFTRFQHNQTSLNSNT